MQRAIWGGRTTVPTPTLLVAVATIAAYVSIIATVPDAQSWPQAAALAGQMLLPAMLASAVFLCIAWRLYPQPGVTWLAAATTMIGVQGLPMLAVATGGTRRGEQVLLSSAIVLGLALLLMVRIAARRNLNFAPVPVGVATGLLLVLVRGIWAYFSVPIEDAERAAAIGGVLLVLVGSITAFCTWRTSTLPLGRRRLTVAVLLWSWSGALMAIHWTTSPPVAVATVVAALITSILTLSAALDLLGKSVRDDLAAGHQLQQQMLTMRDHAREGIEHLHEVKGTIAGIASATNLIRHEDRLTHQHRERLEDMLAHETARLQRLIHVESPLHAVRPTVFHPVEIDEVLRPVITSRRVQGQSVAWVPSHASVAIDADDLAEVVNILLQNAAQHAPGSTVRVFTRPCDGSIELVVTDSGPGVPPELRERIFDWGYSRPGSPGDGVGLAVAQRMMWRRGGRLSLETDDRSGATFVLTMQEVEVMRTDGAARLLSS